VTSVAVVVVVAAGVGAFTVVAHSDTASGAQADPPGSTAAPSTARATTTTTVPRTTTSTLPHVDQPKDQVLPAPGNGIGMGARGATVLAYEARMKALHFDPGPVDGYFDQDTQYAVTTVQKYFNLPRTGVINTAVDFALTHFTYSPAEPKSEPDRVEIDLDRQTLTLYTNWQPQLLTTTSTGSGEHFCGGVDGCQYAITPTGHFHFYELHMGWQKGKLGSMWNPYYFNGSDAVHGLDSVPAYPASHGCARIPMHIANYFYTLVHQGESVFVVGTPKKAGNGYVGPVPTTVPKPTTTTTAKKTPTTVKKPTTPTTKKETTPTTVKSTSHTTPTTKNKP
jgi:peptidoglycan hydrolase-like protein with peptidoglycan-binding domain